MTTINDGDNIYETLPLVGVGSLGILTFELKQTWDIWLFTKLCHFVPFFKKFLLIWILSEKMKMKSSLFI